MYFYQTLQPFSTFLSFFKSVPLISDIASYCKMTEGKLYTVLLSMQRKKELKIIKRYFCPEFHPISVEYERSYCRGM